MDFEEIKKYITDILIENGIQPTADIFQKFESYYNMLIDYNQKVNLTAITDKNEVYVKHFADSLLGIKNYKYGATVCDIGTGAGFPGIALKIARPDLKITLVDSLNKRILFLNSVIEALRLKDINAIHYRAEDVEFKKANLNLYDYVVARAVAQMNTLTEYCLPFVNVGGKFIAYKSQNIDSEIKQAKNCIKMIGGKLHSIENFKLFNFYERNLVIVDKISKTSTLYPRDKNKPKTQPL